MKNTVKILVLLLALTLLAGCFAACDGGVGGDDTAETTGAPTQNDEFADYAATVKFDPNSGRAHATVTVKTYVDGDTTHFNISHPDFQGGVLKARYLGVNTPESTGQIEPWGKKASTFTKETLQKATSIIVESDNDKWNPDSTGDRYLVWVWYKTAENDEYRCLNLEILQNGLAVASKSSDTVYADICVTILNQAVRHKLYVHSKDKDPDFYYGAALPLTLKELKTNMETYRGKDVSFEGVVVRNSNNTAYVEEYDEETGIYFGIQVYYGFNLDYFGNEILTVGNRVLIVGSVQYYETGGTYQIADIKYHAMRPDDPENIQKISDGHAAAYTEVSAKDLLSKKVEIEVTSVDEDGNETVETKTFDYGFLGMHGSASLKGLVITRIYTTQNEDSSNFGALSITCVAQDGTEVVLRTIVLKDADGKTITADAFPVGSVIDAKGVIDVYNGVYQLKVFSAADIVIHN